MENEENTSVISMDLETAEKEFERLCEDWLVDLDEDEEKKECAAHIVKNIKKGSLIIIDDPNNGEGLVIQHHLKKGLTNKGGKKVLIYRPLNVGQLKALDNISMGRGITYNSKLVEILSGEASNMINQMQPSDLSTGVAVGTIFLVY